jgi:hypothetical protein
MGLVPLLDDAPQNAGALPVLLAEEHRTCWAELKTYSARRSLSGRKGNTMIYTMLRADHFANLVRLANLPEAIVANALEIITGDIDDDHAAVSFVTEHSDREIAAMIRGSYLDAFGEGCND